MSTEVNLPFSRTPDPYPLALQGKGVLVVCGRAGPTGVAEHSHPELHVIVLFRSSSFWAKWKTSTGYRERELLPRQVCIIPSNQPHSVHWDRDIDVGVFTLDPAFVLRAASHTTAGNALEVITRYGERDLFVEQLTHALRSEIQHGHIPDPFYLESLATMLSAHLLRRYVIPGLDIEEVAGGLPPYKLRCAIDYIHEYIEKDLSLAEIAGAVQISSYHFARMFKKSAGLSPHQYVVRCRVERAKALLADETLPLVEVASRAGFQNQSHFTTVFRRLTGTAAVVLPQDSKTRARFRHEFLKFPQAFDTLSKKREDARTLSWYSRAMRRGDGTTTHIGLRGVAVSDFTKSSAPDHEEEGAMTRSPTRCGLGPIHLALPLVACAVLWTSTGLAGSRATTAALTPELEAVRAALERYQDPIAAVHDGYLSTVGCIEFSDGGMGVHFLNTSLISPVPDPLKPQILIYEVDRGTLRLAAAEWFVPLATGVKERPQIFGRPFNGPMEGHHPVMPSGLHHYDLHVWLFKVNPAGLFNPTNPSVKCDKGSPYRFMEQMPRIVPHPSHQ